MKINFKAHIKTANILTPQSLLETVQKRGILPKYSHDMSKDPILNELKLLADKYRQSLSIEDKAHLIQYERGMLYEELEHPELTLARNYVDIKKMCLTKDNKKNIVDILNHFNAIALKRIEFLQEPFKTEIDIDKIEHLEKLYNNIKPTNEINTINKDLFEVIIEKGKLIKKEHKIENLDLKTTDYNTLKKFFVDTKFNKKEQENAKKIIESLLDDINTDPELYNLAVWAAGKYKNDSIFEKLKEIALNKDEKNLRKREIAIHSISMYARNKFEEVESTILSIANDDSIFAPLAKIISNKLHGSYYSKNDRELKEMNYKEKQLFKKWRNRLIRTEKELNKRYVNAIDKGLYPFKNLLKAFVKDLGESLIILGADTYTKHAPDKAGIRLFHRSIYNSGDFFDSITGINTPKGTYIDRNSEKYQYNIITHETAHILHNYLPRNIERKIHALYKKAIAENRALDYYAKFNVYEYFAQGFEAYVSIYKPHKYLLDEDALSNTMYKLIDKDPELYKYIKYLIEILE